MKSIMKRVATLLMVPMLIFSTGNMKVSAAENTVNVQLTVEYGQAEARTVAGMVNEFRTGDQTWYWNESDTAKVEVPGLGELTYDATLEKIAMKRAAELALAYSHTRANGESCFTAFNEYSYSGGAYGENIAAGYASAEAVFVGWREDNDPYSGQGHRRNMLSGNFTAIGMGHVYYNGTHYWAMELGTVTSAGDSGVDGTQTVDVETRSGDIKSISTEESTTVALGSTKNLPKVNAVIQSGDMWVQNGSSAPTGTITNATWTVDDSSIAVVSDGKVTGQAVGTTTLTVTAGDASATTTLEVTPEGQEEDNNGDDNTDNPDNGDNTDSNTPDNTPDNGDDNNSDDTSSDNNDDNNDNNDDNNNDNNNDDSNDSNSNEGEDSSDGGQSIRNIISNVTPSIIIPVTSNVGGVKTSTQGIYLATGCSGTIVSTPAADISKDYALASNETPYNKFYNLDVKKSSLAKNTIDSAAAELKATVGPMLNIELGKMSKGKYSLLPSDGKAIRLVIGIPKGFVQSGKTYAVICVREGGSYSVLKDLDTAADTITFETTGGAAAYAIVKY